MKIRIKKQLIRNILFWPIFLMTAVTTVLNFVIMFFAMCNPIENYYSWGPPVFCFVAFATNVPFLKMEFDVATGNDWDWLFLPAWPGILFFSSALAEFVLVFYVL